MANFSFSAVGSLFSDSLLEQKKASTFQKEGAGRLPHRVFLGGLPMHDRSQTEILPQSHNKL